MQLSQITLGVLLLTLPACGGDGAEAPTASASLPESYFSATVHADPLDVVDLREASSVGSEVTVQGKVRDLFESAAFTLADHSLVSCADMGDDDHCKTPWDYCCEDPDALVAGTVVVEFREGERVRKPGQSLSRRRHGRADGRQRRQSLRDRLLSAHRETVTKKARVSTEARCRALG